MTHLTSLQTEFLETVLSLKPRVAAFDCDGTLWSEDAGEGFFHWELDLAPEKRLLPEPIVQWARKRHADYKAGRVDEDTMCGEMVTMHRGLREEVVQQAADAYFAQAIAPTIFPEMRELVERLRQSGCDIWAVSSSCQWVIRSGMRYFGIPQNRILAVEAIVENGLITDRLIRVPSGPGAKVISRPQARLRLRQRDLGPRDASHVEPPLRNQPQPRSKRDRHRQPLEDLSAGHEQRWPIASRESNGDCLRRS